MKQMRLLAALLVTSVAAVGLSCLPDRGPTEPAAPTPNANLLQSTGLLSCSALPYASATVTIGPSGGTIKVGPHTLVVPSGALSAPTTITGVIPQGEGVNAVQFRPAGLQFSRSASLTMSYANCSLLGILLPKRIAYTTDGLQILEYLLSLDNILSRKVTGRVTHFSQYAVAW